MLGDARNTQKAAASWIQRSLRVIRIPLERDVRTSGEVAAHSCIHFSATGTELRYDNDKITAGYSTFGLAYVCEVLSCPSYFTVLQNRTEK